MGTNKKGQGRKPIPKYLKVLNGKTNKDRINHNEPKFYPKAPRCPTWLSKEARKEWRRLSPELERIGLLTKADMAMFAGYCSAVGKLAWAEQMIKNLRKLKPASGGMISGKEGKGFYTLPYVWIYNKSLEQIRSFGSEFGLSPSSRTRISVSDIEAEDDDMFTE